jgi:hypothetical protein
MRYAPEDGMDRLWTKRLDEVRAASARMQGTRQPEMAWNGAAIWHAGTWRARGRRMVRQSKRMISRKRYCREKMKGREEEGK